MSQSESLILALLAVFALPYLAWRAAGLKGAASLVVVQIVTGVLLGPGVLGRLLPALHHAVFTPATVGALGSVASWAVMLFVWLAGLELDLGEAWARRGETGLTAALALGAPLLAGVAAASLLMLRPGWAGPLAAPWQARLGVGMACAVTALPILVLFLQDLGLQRHPLGRRVLRYASLDDVLIWAVLALILMDWRRVGLQIAFVVGFAVASVAVRTLFRRLPPRDRWPAGLVWLLACAWAADAAGLHYMVGAFLAGAVLDKDLFEEDQAEALRRAVLLLLMPVFFLSTGLKTRWSAGGLTVFGAAALLLLASVGGKLAGVRLVSRLLRWRPGEAGVVGWLLQTKALIMIIFASVLLDRRIISDEMFTALLLMAVASTILTLPVVRPRAARLLAETS